LVNRITLPLAGGSGEKPGEGGSGDHHPKPLEHHSALPARSSRPSRRKGDKNVPQRCPTIRLIAYFQIAALSFAALTGCAAPGLWTFGDNHPAKADADNPAVKIVCLWQTAEGRGLDNLPARGFAGQILFLTQGSPTPVEVAGDVRIYLFDDQGPPAEQTKPIHQFDFRNGAWQNYLKRTAWGPTYQLFIPYTRPGEFAANCQLRVRLTPDNGPTILSEPASLSLPGPAAESHVTTGRQPASQPEPATPPLPQLASPRIATKQFQSYTVPQ
jgi:hypothetical protein